MTSARKWLPADWLDEVVPPMEASPDAYIHRYGDGWALRLPDNNPSHDDEIWFTSLEPGQIVGFCWTEHLGEFELTVAADGSWTLDREVPETATHFWLPFDTDTLASSVRELVEGDGDWRPGLEPGCHVMGAHIWSDKISYRFELAPDGQPRFVQCAGAN